ncbi:hypothetical protein [Trinickia sp.]|uniref:hypothetical protein n=1 Tax=Trinickia sp. TaxID=2571163 RepID=UPI003F7E1BE4
MSPLFGPASDRQLPSCLPESDDGGLGSSRAVTRFVGAVSGLARIGLTVVLLKNGVKATVFPVTRSAFPTALGADFSLSKIPLRLRAVAPAEPEGALVFPDSPDRLTGPPAPMLALAEGVEVIRSTMIDSFG